ncbi:hypothetical protein FRC12_007880 [Ceratobasidium sp. 428]|nr:hypothetical protein FRC12_007880 [Ceratobasidium sp. 428]
MSWTYSRPTVNQTHWININDWLSQSARGGILTRRDINEIRSQAVTMANTSPHEFLYSAAMQYLTLQEKINKMDAAPDISTRSSATTVISR